MADDLTYGQLRDALQAAIAATIPDSDDSYHWIYVCDFSDTFVVYCDEDEYLQDDYTIDGEDITLAGDPQPVKAVTTYEPLAAGTGMEARSVSGVRGRTPVGGWQGALGVNPDLVARDLAERLHKLSPDQTSSELVYSPNAMASFYRDLLASEGKITSPGHESRLTRHAEQMSNIAAERERRAYQQLSAGGFEYRVEPNRTDGQGGYFSPPYWANALFATANRPRRVLADLMPRIALPPGVSSINLPIISTGSSAGTQADGSGVPSSDITDSAGSSNIPVLDGFVDVSLQLLEMSPATAAVDWAFFMDLSEATDAQLETQLLSGTGLGTTLVGVTSVAGSNAITYTDSSPTGAEMYPYFGNAAAKIGDNRFVPPECWLMRTARWAWLMTQETTAGLPFGITAPTFLGSTPDTPDPIGGILGWPVFLDDALPANLAGSPGSFTTGGTQDVAVCLRPSDSILLEGEPQTMVAREPLSGSLGARLLSHVYVAAITDRRPTGISVIGGTGFTVQAGE